MTCSSSPSVWETQPVNHAYIHVHGLCSAVACGKALFWGPNIKLVFAKYVKGRQDEGGVAGDGRVVGEPRFHSLDNCTMT